MLPRINPWGVVSLGLLIGLAIAGRNANATSYSWTGGISADLGRHRPGLGERVSRMELGQRQRQHGHLRHDRGHCHRHQRGQRRLCRRPDFHQQRNALRRDDQPRRQQCITDNAAGVTTIASTLNLTSTSTQYFTGSSGTLNLTGLVNCNSSLYFKAGNFSLAGSGAINIGAGSSCVIGQTGTAAFTQSGGLFYASRGPSLNALYLGQTTAPSIYSITGGTLTSHGTLVMGFTAGTQSTLTIDGTGIMNVDGTNILQVDALGTVSQTVNLNNGELRANGI